MTENNQDNNKSTEEANNKAEAPEPNFPEIDKGQVKPEESQQTESIDPEMKKWMDETGSLENAYKRLQGSREEVERYKQKQKKLLKQNSN